MAWIRRATLVFGSTTLATSTVLAVFFLGLALGSECFGRLSRRSTRPLLVYALLELGLAGLALASPLAFDLAERAYGWAYRSLGAGSAGLSLVRVVLVALVVLPPTWLMGGTLPLFCRGAVADAARIGRGIGALYALNTLGAAAGAAAAGFVLIPRLGVQGSIALGAAASAVAGIGVALARGRSRVPPLSPGSARWSGTAGAWVQLLFAGTGFVALGAEVLWTRYLALVVRNTVYTYTLTLSVTLLGIVVGSLIGASLADRVRRRGLLFGWLQVLNALALLGAMTLPPEVWHALGDAVVPYALLLLPPAALSGAAFPVATRMLVAEPALSGAGVGRMAAVNTLGGIAGSLTLGFVLLPGVGLAGSLRLLTGVALAVGLVAWWRFGGFDSRARLAGAAAAAALVWLLLPVAAGTRLPADFLGSRAALVDFREGLASNVAVLRERETLRLEIDRWWQGASRRNHQTTAAHLPMLLHPGARRVLVIGVGTGQTASRFLIYPTVEQLDCAELEPAVFELIGSHFDADWLGDARVRRIFEDGRNHVVHAEQRYDLIAIEAGQLFRPGVASFYTREFYARARERLNPGGLLSQFVPLPFFTPEQLRRAVAAFRDAFPRAALWYNTAELLLVGVNGDAPDPARLRLDALELPAVRRDLAFSHWGGRERWLNRPEVLAAGLLLGPSELERLAAGADPWREDPPELEYAAARVDTAATHELDGTELLRAYLAPLPEPLAAIRDGNLGEIVATARVRQAEALGDLQAMAAGLEAALEAQPEHARALRLLGEVRTAQGRLAEARELLERSAALREDDAQTQRTLAFVLHRQGRIDEARPRYQAALRLWPDDAESHNGLGAALAQRGELVAASQHFAEALRLRPGWANAQANLARAREALADAEGGR